MAKEDFFPVILTQGEGSRLHARRGIHATTPKKFTAPSHASKIRHRKSFQNTPLGFFLTESQEIFFNPWMGRFS